MFCRMLLCKNSGPVQLTNYIFLPRRHLSNGASHEFAPTAAILGGLLGQDILRALSRKEKPVMNFLAVDTMAGTGTTTRWGMGAEEEA
jgi:hypothetical protein